MHGHRTSCAPAPESAGPTGRELIPAASDRPLLAVLTAAAAATTSIAAATDARDLRETRRRPMVAAALTGSVVRDLRPASRGTFPSSCVSWNFMTSTSF